MPKYKVPREVREIAERAIAYNLSRPLSQRAAYKDKDGKRVPGTGMRTARRLASGAVDEAQLDLMIAWFARHGESEAETQARRDRTSKAAIAWALWGGNPGRRFAKAQKRQIERDRAKK